MAIDVVVQSLMRVELFAGLMPLQLAELARCSDRIVYKRGDAIITEGAVGDAAVYRLMPEPGVSHPRTPMGYL